MPNARNEFEKSHAQARERVETSAPWSRIYHFSLKPSAGLFKEVIPVPFIEALKLALSSILSHKLRSFLTLLGVIFGVATVIVVVSLIEGFNSYVDEKIANIGTNAFAVQKYSIEDFSSVEALNAARRRNRDVTLDDLEAMRARGGATSSRNF